MEERWAEVDRSLVQKLDLFENALELCHQRLLRNFREQLERARAGAKAAATAEEIKGFSIVFSDFFRRNMQKVANMTTDKNEMFLFADRVAREAEAQLSTETKRQYQLDFERICRYEEKKGGENALYADSGFCRYIVTKTFKKNFGDVFDFAVYACAPLLARTTPLRIASIGGGPGNDALAVYFLLKNWNGYSSTLKEVRVIPVTGETRSSAPGKKPKPSTGEAAQLKCCIDVYDLNFTAWKEVMGPLVEKLLPEVQAQWSFINFSADFQPLSAEPDVITVSWALNEVPFNAAFWRALIAAHRNAFFIVLEGGQEPTDKLAQIFLDEQFSHIYYEKYEKPRKLCAFNTKQISQIE